MIWDTRRVEFTDTRPGANIVAPEVLLRLTATVMDMGTQQVETTSVDGLRYTARGSYFPMQGPREFGNHYPAFRL